LTLFGALFGPLFGALLAKNVVKSGYNLPGRGPKRGPKRGQKGVFLTPKRGVFTPPKVAKGPKRGFLALLALFGPLGPIWPKGVKSCLVSTRDVLPTDPPEAILAKRAILAKIAKIAKNSLPLNSYSAPPPFWRSK